MKKVAITLAILLFVCIVAGNIAVMIIGRDIPLPDTTDLVVEKLDLPPEHNAFTYFVSATNYLYWPTNSLLVTDYLAEKPVEESVIQEILTRNANMMEAIGKGLKCQKCLTPEATGYDTLLPYLADWRNMGRIMGFKARHERLTGRYAEATHTCISMLRFGNLIQNDSECLIHYLVGVAVLDIGLRQAESLARDTGTPVEELTQLSKALGALGPFDSGLKRAFKVEYRVFANSIDQLKEGKFGPAELVGHGATWNPSKWRRKRLVGYSFQPNKTKLMSANIIRDSIKNVGLPYAKVNLYDVEKVIGLNEDMFKGIVQPNAVGRILLKIIAPASDRMVDKKCRAECDVAGTRLVIVCNAYRKIEGKLPADLQSLVPKYLATVPADPYDGKPFRYSPSKGIVYSVGSDLKDSGGSSLLRYENNKEDMSSKMRWECEDAVFRIDERRESPSGADQ